MTSVDEILRPLAAANYGLITRNWVKDAGGNDQLIARRINRRRWTEEHAGVYNTSPIPLDWKGRLRAATLAAGPHAFASHRAAVVLHGLDGIETAPTEITVPTAVVPNRRV